jgi:hypothetical protein
LTDCFVWISETIEVVCFSALFIPINVVYLERIYYVQILFRH